MSSNSNSNSSFLFIIFWIVLFAILVFLFNRWHMMQAGGIEKVTVNSTTKSIVIKMSANNTYLAKGSINNINVEFMVDTGANSVALPNSLAIKAGLKPMSHIKVHTASGQTTGQITRIKELKIGPIVLHNIRAIIMSDNSKSVLLGMTALRKLELRQRANYLEIIQHIK